MSLKTLSEGGGGQGQGRESGDVKDGGLKGKKEGGIILPEREKTAQFLDKKKWEPATKQRGVIGNRTWKRTGKKKTIENEIAPFDSVGGNRRSPG